MSQLTDSSFLGFAAGRHGGPAALKLRIKAGAATSHVDWLPGGPNTDAHRAPFTIRGTGWEEIAVELPATGPLGVVRLYLPAQTQPVEIDWIEITSQNSPKPIRTGF